MAIKTQSQLDKFNNDTNSNQFDIGKNMAFFKDGYLTRHDKSDNDLPISPTITTNWRTQSLDYAYGRTEYDQQDMPIAVDHYWSSIFEISKPTSPSSPTNNDSNEQYDSMHTTYEDILKNILWDVKTYLNWKNNLNNYNLSTIVEGTQLFTGTKYFQGKVYAVSGEYDYLSASNLSAVNSKITNLTATTGKITNLSATSRLSASNLTAYNSKLSTVTVSALTATSRLSASNLTAYNSKLSTVTVSALTATSRLSASNLTAYTSNLSTVNAGTITTTGNITIPEPKWLNGYAKGLKSGENTKYGIGNSSTPVYFENGIPKVVSQTAKALSAQYLVDSNWKGLSCGTAGLKTPRAVPYEKQYTVVKFVNGIPVECNEIDYAHHAYWSDIGERYLADKEYEPGTLVKFGGEKEITIADDEVNAIVSTHAFDLNACLSGGTVICLCGRVPTKVIGKISKFDRIMLSKIPGIACKWDGSCKPIGRALESNEDEGIKLVECVSQFMV